MPNTVERLQSIANDTVAIRRHLHRNPELSFQEYDTATFIRQQLDALDIPWRAAAGTGTVAHIGTGGRCVALRADIDALPIVEETGLPYASQHHGVMHACGHDMHTTMLLAAARLLKQDEALLGGTVKLVFQPGEEKTPGGASLMIADGALADPVPDIMFGQHVNPDAPAGTLSFVSGPMMAAADEIYITINGYGAHAAQPHKGRDPIMTAAAIVQHLQSLITKHRNPLDPGVLTITSIHGGTATNIIPETVELKGTLRAFSQTWREEAWAWIETQVPAIAALHGCTATVTILRGYPPLVNDAAAVAIARAAAETMSPGAVEDFEPKMWAEDFSYYTSIVPCCFWMLGARPSGMAAMPGLHNAAFAPDESAMLTGAALMVEVVTSYLSAHRSSHVDTAAVRQ